MKKITLLSLAFFITSLSIGQTVTTFAGKANDDPDNNTESGTANDINSTYFSEPSGICFDDDGRMYIAERNKIRAYINTNLYIRAGSLQAPNVSEGYKNGTGTQSTFRKPGGIVSNSAGDIFVADVDNHCIRKIASFNTLGTGQTVTTFAGANSTPGLPGFGTEGYADGMGTAARFKQPTDICIDNSGNFYVTEYGNFTVRKIRPDGRVSTVAGSAGVEGTADGTGTAATFGGPWGIAMYDANRIVVTDPWNTNIRMINVVTQEVTTLAGPKTGPSPGTTDGTLTAARFKKPKGIAVIDGIIYVADENVIRAIDVPNNSVTTFAGNRGSFSITNGTGSSAAFTEISDIQSDGQGNMYVSENSRLVASNVIRKVTIDNLAPTSNFTASKRDLLVNEATTLTNTSSGQASTSRTWTITPADYSIVSGSLTENTVEIKCSKTGFYEVSLSVTNEYGTDLTTKEDFLAVSNTGSISSYKNTDLVKLFPNPVNNELQLQFETGVLANSSIVDIYHINGNKVMSIDPTQTVNTSALANGIYFVTVRTGELNYAKRFIVSHK